MDNKSIKSLALSSFKKNKLDEARIRRIGGLLGRKDLKMYLKAIKRIIDKQTVYITIPENSEIKSYTQNIFSKIYPEKNIKITVDPTLMAGVKVRNYDIIYELSLKDVLKYNLENLKGYDR